MICCGLSRGLNGEGRNSQLVPHLQNLIAWHREYFDGKSPLATDDTEFLHA